MSEYFNCSSIDGVFKQIGKFLQQQSKEKERTLTEIIKNYDFIVGSKECKFKLMEVLPEGVNIICSPLFEDPTIIYAIKKFDVTDFINSPCEEVKNGGTT